MDSGTAEDPGPNKAADSHHADDPLKGLSHLADGLEPGSFQVDDYEEVCFPLNMYCTIAEQSWQWWSRICRSTMG